MIKIIMTLILMLTTLNNYANETSVVLITTEHWPPNNYLDAQGQISGKATSVVKQLFAQADVAYKIELLPWARAYHLTLNKPNAAIYSILRSKERESLFQWVCPIIAPTKIYFYRLKARSDIKLTGINDVKNYLISVSRNEFDHQYLMAKGFIEEKDFYVSFDDRTLIKKLFNKRTELIIATEDAIRHNTRALGFDPNEITQAMEIADSGVREICLAFSLSTPTTTVDRIRQALLELNRKNLN